MSSPALDIHVKKLYTRAHEMVSEISRIVMSVKKEIKVLVINVGIRPL